MGAISTTEEVKEQIEDNISNIEVKKEDKIDPNKLAALKAKAQSKQENKMPPRRARSLEFGVIGSGHCGSKLASVFYNDYGYSAVAINTAIQDLKSINIPDSNKLLLEYGLGGASRELSIGKAAAETHRDSVKKLIEDKLGNSQVFILTFSLGGGSGAGSSEVLIDILTEIGKPIVVLVALPMDSDDIQAKSNALETLAKLARLAQNKKIQSLLVIDNSKIEARFHDISQMSLFDVANKAIINPIDAFNTFSAMSSSSKALDSMEFSKILLDGESLAIYGEMTVENYQEDTAIAEAIIQDLENGLLASGFNLKESKYVGYIVAASQSVWNKINSASINYANSMIADLCGTPRNIFKGLYTIDSPEDSVKIYSFFSGLGLPSSRVDQLKTETKELQAKVKQKDEARNLTLNIDTGHDSISEAQKIKDKISQKSSSFSKFIGGTLDKRK